MKKIKKKALTTFFINAGIALVKQICKHSDKREAYLQPFPVVHNNPFNYFIPLVAVISEGLATSPKAVPVAFRSRHHNFVIPLAKLNAVRALLVHAALNAPLVAKHRMRLVQTRNTSVQAGVVHFRTRVQGYRIFARSTTRSRVVVSVVRRVSLYAFAGGVEGMGAGIYVYIYIIYIYIYISPGQHGGRVRGGWQI